MVASAPAEAGSAAALVAVVALGGCSTAPRLLVTAPHGPVTTATPGDGRTTGPPGPAEPTSPAPKPAVAATAPPTAATPRPRADARPCLATEVQAAPGVTNGAGGTTLIPLLFTNRASTMCTLVGYPVTTATEPGRPPVVARHETPPEVGPPRNLVPGATAELLLMTASTCDARPGGGSGPTYRQVDVTLPGGGVVTIALELDVGCGVAESAFGTSS